MFEAGVPVEAIAEFLDWESYDDESLREWLAPVYRDLPDEQIDEIVRAILGEGVVLEDVEDVWGTLGQVASAVLPIVGTALGAVAGGPVGAAAGGAIGGAAGGAISSATSKSASQPSPAPPPPPAPSPAAPPPATPAPKAAPRKTMKAPRRASRARRPSVPGAANVQGVAAAAQLLSILFRPEVLQALLAMAFGSAGPPDMPVAGTPVPLGAFTNLIGTLANQASTDYHAVAAPGGPQIPEYLTQADGALKCDIAVPEERAGVLLSMLQAEAVFEDDEDMTREEWWDELLFQDPMYDQLEMSELDADSEDINLDEGENGEGAW